MADHKGKPPWNLYCDAQKGTNPAYRDGYDRIFGKKPLPHGGAKAKTIHTDWYKELGIDVIKSVLAYETYCHEDGREDRTVPNVTYSVLISKEIAADIGLEGLKLLTKRIEQSSLLCWLASYDTGIYMKPEGDVAKLATNEDIAALLAEDWMDKEIPRVLLEEHKTRNQLILQRRVDWEIKEADFEGYHMHLYGRFAWLWLAPEEKRHPQEVELRKSRAEKLAEDWEKNCKVVPCQSEA